MDGASCLTPVKQSSYLRLALTERLKTNPSYKSVVANARLYGDREWATESLRACKQVMFSTVDASFNHIKCGYHVIMVSIRGIN